MIKPFLATLLWLFAAGHLDAQTGYSNFARQSARLSSLAKTYPQLASLRALTRTAGGREVWQLTIGTGAVDTKPAMVVVGGVEGNHLLGTELALGFAENLLQGSQTDSIRALLQRTSFYIFPNMSPDAMEQYFAPLKYERQGNSAETDDDRDGRRNEDPAEDLDGNGRITVIRVESPIGEYRLNPDDPRSLVKADLTRGEKGSYQVYTEGIDNDKDGLFNEDGEGGVWFNRNFTYKFPSFSPGAGEFAVSEPENRALLDYLFERFNVYAVISFSSNNNLSTPYTFNAATAGQTLIGSWLQPDVRVDSLVSDLYNKTVNLKDAPRNSPAGGDFLSWAYYHYGRYSFSTPGWWVPKVKPDSTKNEKAFTVDDPVAACLRWAAHEGIGSVFTDWKPIQHPDFPNQKVEAGGLDPFALTNPPYSLVDNLVKKHSQFLVRFAGLQPDLDLINLKTEKLSNGLTRISFDVINRGVLSAPSKLGERNYWTKRIQVKLTTGSGQSIVSGRKLQTLNALEGYSSQSMSWLIRGSGPITIEAGSPATGTKTIDIRL